MVGCLAFEVTKLVVGEVVIIGRGARMVVGRQWWGCGVVPVVGVVWCVVGGVVGVSDDSGRGGSRGLSPLCCISAAHSPLRASPSDWVVVEVGRVVNGEWSCSGGWLWMDVGSGKSGVGILSGRLVEVVRMLDGTVGRAEMRCRLILTFG